MASDPSYECSACGQTYVGGSKAAAGACELCGRVGSLTCDGKPVPVSVSENRTLFVIDHQAAARLARRLMAMGRTTTEIQEALVDEGLAEEAAAEIVRQAGRQDAKEASNAALISVIVGAAFFAAGSLLGLYEKEGTIQSRMAHWLMILGLAPFLGGIYKIFTRPKPDHAGSVTRTTDRSTSADAGDSEDSGSAPGMDDR